MTADQSRSRLLRHALGGAAGLAAGATVGLVVLALSGVALAHRLTRGDADPGLLIEAAHVPPLLVEGGKPVELRYDIYCAPPGGDPESGLPCAASGVVNVREGNSGPFGAIPLELDVAAAEGRYVADVPAALSSSASGFSYYAVLRNEASGAQTTLPAGGASAPQRSLPLGRAANVSLGAHAFGLVRGPDERVASAAWGDGADEAGLEAGPQSTPIGASAFDVDASGSVLVLDEAKKRVLRFARGAARPEPRSLDVNGTLADMSVGPDGTIYVLEFAGRSPSDTPAIRSFTAAGRPLGAWDAAERTVAAIRMGPVGPSTLSYPSGEWLPVAVHGRALGREAQLAAGRAGRPLAGGGEVVALRTGNELRLALLRANGVQQTWRITSDTPLAEVQLAEPLRDGMVALVRVYSDEQDEFVALVLDGNGLARTFSVDSADWAEAAPISRFRLVGSSLYRLGSTPAGIFVDRFDLEVSP
jgi:hypothetical protein